MTATLPEPWYSRLFSPLKCAWEQLKTDWREAGEEVDRRDPWEAEEREAARRDFLHCLRAGPFREHVVGEEVRRVRARRAAILKGLQGPGDPEDGPANG